MNYSESQCAYSHIPVMVKEVLDYLNLSKNMNVLDATIGEGGHSEEIIKVIEPNGKLIGTDRDREILEVAKKRLSSYSKVSLFNANFADISEVIQAAGIENVDAALFDLGASTYHFYAPDRGFSFDSEGPLDMRFNREEGETASELLYSLSEKEIEKILREYGEEVKSRSIARSIYRNRKNIKTTSDLKKIALSATGYRKSRIHAATKTFQAFRIAVNNELENIHNALSTIWRYVKKGGRIVVISFHSLEDRVVKNTFKELKAEEKLKILTPKPLKPCESEIKVNRNSRSAMLRAAEVL
ncbi:MAG: 16S rRNA (cytosine(1402)-N(4))-methyltransferase RsmH [Planctomycetota bacterium]